VVLLPEPVVLRLFAHTTNRDMLRHNPSAHTSSNPSLSEPLSLQLGEQDPTGGAISTVAAVLRPTSGVGPMGNFSVERGKGSQLMQCVGQPVDLHAC